MEQEREKPVFLPEAFPGVDWEQEEAAGAPNRLARPGLYAEAQDEQEPGWMQPDMPTEPCPCCGADIPENPSPGYICPMCWWETDPFVVDEDAPSDQNHGLSLAEAQLNFRVFGICDPWLRWENEK